MKNFLLLVVLYHLLIVVYQVGASFVMLEDMFSLNLLSVSALDGFMYLCGYLFFFLVYCVIFTKDK